jgi:hypothetical protein
LISSFPALSFFPSPQPAAGSPKNGGVLSEPSFFSRTLPSRSHTSSHMSGHHLAITWRLCSGPGASEAQGSRALRLWQSSRQWRAVPWSCMDAAPGCRLQRRSSANILRGVARASSAGTKSGSSARSWVLLTMLAPVVENRTVQGPATARRRSELDNRRRR